MNGGSAHGVSEVLQVHTRYRRVGGEDYMVEAERKLLEAAGISVHQVIFDNADLQDGGSIAGDLRVAASAIWSRSAERQVRAAIEAHRPDVVHVHNTFAAASPSVYAAASGVPVVQTLHNYRMVCPVATAFRDGHACTDCVGRFVPWPAVRHTCLHGSTSQSLVAATTIAVHRTLGTYRRRISRYVALTSFQRQIMIDGGLPPERVGVIPNFLEPDPRVGEGPRSGILYVGRLTEEKGVRVLLDAAAARPGAIRVAGDGPLQHLAERAAAAGHIDYLGPLPPSDVITELGRSIAMVIPSTWFEGFPLTVLQAFATGTPVIGSRIGSLAEIIEEGVAGTLTEPHDTDGLAAKLSWATGHSTEMGEMGRRARQEYETRFRGPSHLGALLDTYRAARDGFRSSIA